MEDVTRLNVIEIKVNETKEIYMIKSSVVDLQERNKLSGTDVEPFLQLSNHSNLSHKQSSSSSSIISSSSSSLFPGMNVLLYNPELADTDLTSFMKSPGRFSFMDELNCERLFCDSVVEKVGPKPSYLIDEVSLFIVKEE